MKQESSENYNIKTRIGPLLFNIYLDDTFRSANASSLSNQHNHSTYEIHFIIQGAGLLVLEREEVQLQSNCYYVIPPGIYHALIPDKQKTLSKYTIRFDFVELNEYDFYFPGNEIETIKSALAGFRYFSIMDQEDNNNLLFKINRELEQQSLGYYTKLQSYFNQILINVIRASEPSYSTYRIPSRNDDDKRSLIIESFFDQYDFGLTLEDLAAKLHLSPRQTNRIIQKMYNASFRQKLTDIRVEEGKNRLKNTKDSIMLIGEKLGFKSHVLFCSMFKQKTGMTPQAYRRQANSKANL